LFKIKPGFFDYKAWRDFEAEFKRLKGDENIFELINKQDPENDQTVLHLASDFPLKYFADLLDNYRVDISLKNKAGRTALEEVIIKGKARELSKIIRNKRVAFPKNLVKTTHRGCFEYIKDCNRRRKYL